MVKMSHENFEYFVRNTLKTRDEVVALTDTKQPFKVNGEMQAVLVDIENKIVSKAESSTAAQHNGVDYTVNVASLMPPDHQVESSDEDMAVLVTGILARKGFRARADGKKIWVSW